MVAGLTDPRAGRGRPAGKGKRPECGAAHPEREAMTGLFRSS